MYKLRTYQERGKNDIVNFLLSSRGRNRGIVVAPCGAGKSLYIAAAANEISSPILVIQPSAILLKQNYEKYTSYGNNASIFSATLKEKEIGHVTFATPGSIVRATEKLKNLGVRLVIIDECHTFCLNGSQVDRTIKALGNDVRVVGLTATPVILTSGLFGAELKMLNRVRKSIFNTIIHTTQIPEVVAGGFWAKLNYEIHLQKKEQLKNNSNGSEFTDESLNTYFFENDIDKQVVDIVNRIKGSNKSILVFAPSISAAEALTRKIPGAACIHSKMSQSSRDNVLLSFRGGTTQVVVNVNVLATGFDFPELSAVICCSPTLSIAKYYQQLGRCCRPHPHKEFALIVDLSGNYKRFGKIEELTFENVEGYGWGMFNGDYLLTGKPLASGKVKRSELVKKELKVTDGGNVSTTDKTIWFGKYKGQKLDILPTDYIKWMLCESGWEFNGQKMSDLKKDLEKLFAQQN